MVIYGKAGKHDKIGFWISVVVLISSIFINFFPLKIIGLFPAIAFSVCTYRDVYNKNRKYE